MLASHNSFTYLKPCNLFYRLISNYWKCQSKTLDEQYKEGVRYFDIRVFRNKNEWQICHGIVNLPKYFQSLKNLCEFMKNLYPDCYYRIVLEKGDSIQFMKEVPEIEDKYPYLHQIIIKSPWTIIYSSDLQGQIIDYCFKDWSFKNSLKSLFTSVIKSNPKITNDEAIESNNVNFVDFV